MQLTRDKILQAKDIQTEEVQVPEWKGSVLVRGLTGIERDQWQSTIVQSTGRTTKVRMEQATARLVQLSIVDKEGKRLFNDNDIMALNSKSAAALNRIYDVACRLSGLTNEEVEEMAKNSPILAQSAGSTSD